LSNERPFDLDMQGPIEDGLDPKKEKSMAGKSKRGFASMDEEKQRQIASKGGKAAHAKGTAHEFTPEEAREAGRKGGQAAHNKETAHQLSAEQVGAAGRTTGQE
jgi:uncharacterized protein